MHQNNFMAGQTGYGGHGQAELTSRRSVVSTGGPFRSSHFRNDDDQFG